MKNAAHPTVGGYGFGFDETTPPRLSYLTLTASRAPVTGLDDSVFIISGSSQIFAAVTNTDQVMEIDYRGFTPGTLLASIDSLKEIAFANQTTGGLTLFVTGLSRMRSQRSQSRRTTPCCSLVWGPLDFRAPLALAFGGRNDIKATLKKSTVPSVDAL